jgi:DNA sulfur modification protein DndB
MPNPAEAVFPSIRARMGDWWYYVTTMSLTEVAARVLPVDKIHEKKELKTWIQRTLEPTRLSQIAQYLLTQEQHFFNGIVVGIYGGEPEWFPVSIGESPTLELSKVDERTQTAIGLLKLGGTEEIFAIDGQHRVEGIKEALKQNPEIGAEDQCIIFVAHKKTDAGRERTRRLFSTLNKYAVRVSPGELVALSEDDTFAIVVRKLIDHYKPLNADFVPLTATTNIPEKYKGCITTVLGLNTLVEIIALPKTPEGGKERKQLKIGPPHEQTIQAIYDQHCSFWESLRKYIPEIKKVTNSAPSQELASKYRNEEGGHVLFRPFGQKAFANAVRIMMDRDIDMDKAIKALSKVPFYLHQTPWVGVLWNPTAKKVMWGNDTLAQNLFLYMVGQEIPGKSKNEPYDLEEAYRKALDNPEASIDDIPIIPIKK